MHEFDVKVSTYGGEPESYSWPAETAREAAIGALAQLDAMDADYLTIAVGPGDPDAPPTPSLPGGADEWEGVEPDEVAVNSQTGEVARWDPDVVARKGGPAPPWVRLAELSPFDVFDLLHLRSRRAP